jgi:hypothetical protein
MDDPNVVSPGILGFLAFFLLAVALFLLVRNMNGHLRRMRYRAEAMEAREAREAMEAMEADQAPDDGPAAPRDEDPPAGPVREL